MPIVNIEDFNDLPTYTGPKFKTRETWHLEYIIHSLLKDPKLDFKIESNSLVIYIEGEKFNLTDILQGELQFEFISLDEIQLDLYLFRVQDDLKPYITPPWRTKKNHWDLPHEHLREGERYALFRYTLLTDYLQMNTLLRSPLEAVKYKDISLLLLTICVAAHALYNQPLQSGIDENGELRPSIPPINQLLYRSDRTYSKNSSKNIEKSRGFLSTSKEEKAYQPITQPLMRTIIYPNEKYHPPLLDITELSASAHEKEVLFAPNTEFYYQKTDEPDLWHVKPYYNPDAPKSSYSYDEQLDKNIVGFKEYKASRLTLFNREPLVSHSSSSPQKTSLQTPFSATQSNIKFFKEESSFQPRQISEDLIISVNGAALVSAVSGYPGAVFSDLWSETNSKHPLILNLKALLKNVGEYTIDRENESLSIKVNSSEALNKFMEEYNLYNRVQVDGNTLASLVTEYPGAIFSDLWAPSNAEHSLVQNLKSLLSAIGDYTINYENQSLAITVHSVDALKLFMEKYKLSEHEVTPLETPITFSPTSDLSLGCYN